MLLVWVFPLLHDRFNKVLQASMGMNSQEVYDGSLWLKVMQSKLKPQMFIGKSKMKDGEPLPKEIHALFIGLNG